MHGVIEDEVHYHAVTRILAQCAKCGFAIRDICMGLIDEEELEYEEA